MSAPWIHDGRLISAHDAERLLGSKAARLIRLVDAGQSVPKFYCIKTEAFRHAVESDAGSPSLGQLLQSLASLCDGAELDRCASEIRARLFNIPLTHDLQLEIASSQERCFPNRAAVAVRSSVCGEDGDGHSFAGMHDTVLAVNDPFGLFDAIRRVWASAFSDRAIAYRRECGLPCTEIAPAVMVQEMIDARQSGVLFTCNPVTGNVNEIIASAVPGLGEELVRGECSSDSYVIDKQSRHVQPQLAVKHEKLIVSGNENGVERVLLDEREQSAGTLTDEQLGLIADLAISVEAHFGRPQDIEFCFDASGRLYLLQSRPVVNVDEYGPAAGNSLVWDNSNIIESYSGVTSPMTFSFIRRAYAIVYHCFAEVMGIPPRVVREHRGEFENMLGLFRGRVYYNLRNWYRLVQLFPGYQYNSRFMETMMGLREPLPQEPTGNGDRANSTNARKPGLLRRWFVELPALLGLLTRSSWNFLRIGTVVGRFQARFNQHYQQWSAIDFRRLRPHELAALYTKMEDALLWHWKAPIINDFFVMVFFGILRKLCSAWCGDQSGALTNGLVCGEKGLASAEPAKMLLKLAAMAYEDEPLRTLILNTPAEELPRHVAGDARFADFQAEFSRYLELYGLRCVHELKLEETSLRDRPQLVYEQIRGYLALNDPAAINLQTIEDRQHRVRAEAESRAFGTLSQSRGWLPRKTLFRRVLQNARLGIRNREEMRLARTRIYAILREMLRSIGEQFAVEEILDHSGDIFYLTLDEVWDFIKGTAVSTDLKGLARVRKAEYDRYRDESVAAPDNRFVTFGLAYHKNLLRRAVCSSTNGDASKQADARLLQGVGCCPGVVSGPVILARDPSQALRTAGGILAAERTDPGWVTVYPAFAAILVERGSMLSHSAIVAREMGIPTIVGIDGLTTRLRTGQHVKMDGAAGTVEILPTFDPRFENADPDRECPNADLFSPIDAHDLVDLEVAVEESQVAGK